MSALGWWLLVGFVVWCAVSVPAAFVIGRVIGRRDAQKPAAPAPQPEPQPVESDMDVFLSMIREPSEPSPSEPYRYRGEQR